MCGWGEHVRVYKRDHVGMCGCITHDRGVRLHPLFTNMSPLAGNRNGRIDMSDKVSYDKAITFSDGAKDLLSKTLENLEISFRCNVTGTKQSNSGGGLALGLGVDGVRVRLNFAGTTLLEAMRFASGGQSFRVAVQSRLRMTAKKSLENEVQVFSMSEVFRPTKKGFVWIAPSMKKLKVLEDMLEAGDIDQDLFDVSKIRFDAAILAETEERGMELAKKKA